MSRLSLTVCRECEMQIHFSSGSEKNDVQLPCPTCGAFNDIVIGFEAWNNQGTSVFHPNVNVLSTANGSRTLAVDMKKVRRLINFITDRFFGTTISDKMITEAIKDFIQVDKKHKQE